MAEVTAFVLAGGQSTRMGRDKALLQLGGRTLLEWALEAARAVTADVRIVGQRDKFAAWAPVVEDLFPGRGPLAGIHAALLASSTPLNLVLGVDTPFLEPGFLRYLRQEAEASGATVTVPRIAGQNQPLCAVYRREFASLAEEALAAGRHKIDALFEKTSLRVIEEAELRGLAFDPGMFHNLNTPEDWQQACTRAQK
jgi:molybdopterin-guanine dinucleotide biosynthesis protein A